MAGPVEAPRTVVRRSGPGRAPDDRGRVPRGGGAPGSARRLRCRRGRCRARAILTATGAGRSAAWVAGAAVAGWVLLVGALWRPARGLPRASSFAGPGGRAAAV